MALRLVLFDLVGTLLDERADYEALDAVMDEVRVRYDMEAPVGDLSGSFALALMEIIRGEPEGDEEPAAFVPFRDAAPDIFAGILTLYGVETTTADKRWFWDRYLEIQRRAWRPYPEVPETLEWLADGGLRMGAVTDADRYLYDDILPRTGLAEHLEVRVAAEDVGHVKPHPAMFHRALKEAGVKPSEALMVGDSYERDLVGAHAAGIRHLVLLDRHQARTVPVPTIRDLSGLRGALATMPLP